MGEIRFLPCGDSAVTVEFGNEIDDMLNAAVHAFAAAVEGLNHPCRSGSCPYLSLGYRPLPALAAGF